MAKTSTDQTSHNFKWADLAFASKKPINQLKATFILAPRKMSVTRFKQLVKQNLSTGNILLGLSAEDYVLGFEGQPQFEMLSLNDVQSVIDNVNKAKLPHKIYTLEYSQRDAVHIINKLKVNGVLLINGSWKLAFHLSPSYYALVENKIPFSFNSPFYDDNEAKEYAKKTNKLIQKKLDLAKIKTESYSELEVIRLVDRVAQQSYDNTFQIAAAIAKPKSKGKYQIQHTSYNSIVPYETFAMHHGASREKFLSPPNDLNHYDTVHAEVSLVIEAAKANTDLSKSTLFVNVMPCPVCSRVLVKSGTKRIVYVHDHSDGYAVSMLGQAGIKVERLVP